tara:strand:- start:213 stop:422 length:210 start_codon:yes stop_codon:yes gene_type:complete
MEMELVKGQLIKFCYINGADDAMLGIVTKISRGQISIVWVSENRTHTVSYKDFEHAVNNGVYKVVEEKG